MGSRKGQTLILASLNLFLLFGLIGLVADLGYGYFMKMQAQATADAAASAASVYAMNNGFTCGSGGVVCGTAYTCAGVSPPTNALQAGCLYATGTNALSGQTVSLIANNTAISGGPTPSYWVQATVSTSAPNLFVYLSGFKTKNIAAESTAGIQSGAALSNPPCIYVLNTTAQDAFSLGNGATVTTSSCGITVYSNNTNPEAMLVNGGATVVSPVVNLNGKLTANNGGCVKFSSSGSCATSGFGSAGTETDPLSSLSPPSSGCTCASSSSCNSSQISSSWQSTPYTPTPGVYCNGFSLGNGMSATMSPGVYYINGGTVSIQGGTTLGASGGVMFYLTNGASVNIANGATVNLGPETTGTYKGILFYQDRGDSAADTFAGGASMKLAGTLYLPAAALTINNGANAQVMALVVNTVSFQGGATFNNQTTSSPTGLSTGGSPSTWMIQ